MDRRIRDEEPLSHRSTSPADLSVPSVLVLSNYRGTGIGDFGLNLYSHLKGQLPHCELMETKFHSRGFSQQLLSVLNERRPIVANLGLTAWGKSGMRNFVGFGMISLRRLVGRRDLVLLHNVIEVITISDSGYNRGKAVRFGAHAAIRLLGRCRLVVFSPIVGQSLRNDYHFRDFETVELPCIPASARDSPPAERSIVSVGYLAPYKGIELFLEIAEALKSRWSFRHIGGPHRILSEDPDYSKRLAGILDRAKDAGVQMTGRIPENKMNELLERAYLGLLTHTSSGGASAAFATLASNSIPVVATRIPEFERLERAGAGIVTCPATVRDFVKTIGNIESDSGRWADLSRRQASYSERNSWDRFARGIVLGLSRNRPRLMRGRRMWDA